MQTWVKYPPPGMYLNVFNTKREILPWTYSFSLSLNPANKDMVWHLTSMGSDLKIFDKASRNNTMPHKVYMLKFTNQVHNQILTTVVQEVDIYFIEQQKSINLLEHKFFADGVLYIWIFL